MSLNYRILGVTIAALAGIPTGILVSTWKTTVEPTRVEQITAWIKANEPEAAVFCPNITDREYWKKNPLLIKQDKPPSLPLPPNTVSLVSVLKNGTNQELTFNTGEWLPAIDDAITTIRDTQWTEDLFEKEFTDLHAVQTGAALARTLCALKPRLKPETYADGRNTIRKKITGPYLKDLELFQRDKLGWGDNMCPWLENKDNWVAVCIANILYAGLAVESDPKMRAELIARSEMPLEQYLESAEEDGYLPSGIRYWNYGFGHLMFLAERLNKATGGKMQLAGNPKIEKMAGFKPKCLIARQGNLEFYPLFADNDNPIDRELWVEALCAKYFGTTSPPNPETEELASPLIDLTHSLTNTNPGAGMSQPTQTAYFPSAGVLISRSAFPITIAAKAGHNQEEHNHNDIGSYTVFHNGNYLTGDAGTLEYTLSMFGGERYTNNILNSYGHPVPVVDNHLQSSAPGAVGKVLSHQISDTQDSVSYDLSAAYKTPGLESLVRTITIQKSPMLEIRITDTFTAEHPIAFETPLIYQEGTTYSETVLLKNLIVNFESPGEIRLDNDVIWKNKTRLHRTAAILTKPSKKGTISTIFHIRETISKEDAGPPTGRPELPPQPKK